MSAGVGWRVGNAGSAAARTMGGGGWGTRPATEEGKEAPLATEAGAGAQLAAEEAGSTSPTTEQGVDARGRRG